MFGIGWPELILISVIAVLVLGPQQLPAVLKSVVGVVRTMRRMTREFHSGVDDLVKEAELEEVRAEMRALRHEASIKNQMNKVIDGSTLSSDGDWTPGVPYQTQSSPHDSQQNDQRGITPQATIEEPVSSRKTQSSAEAGDDNSG